MAKRKDNQGRNLRTGESQRKDGRYMFRWTTNGKEHSVYSMDLAELREKEKAILRDIDDGVSSIENGKLTLNDAFEHYINSKSDIKQSTLSNYKHCYDRYVKEVLGNMRINSIKYSTIVEFYKMLLFDKGLKIGSVANVHTIIHPVFAMLVRDGIIRTNPCDDALHKLKKSHDARQEKRIALSIDEQEAFISFVRETKKFNRLLPLFTCFLGTGCRVGELLGLRWCDCDFEENTISINHTLAYYQPQAGKQNEYHITTPKTSAGVRTIPMLNEVKKALLQEKKKCLKSGFCESVIDGYSGFVFGNREHKVLCYISVDDTIKRIVKAYNKREKELASNEKREPILIRDFSAHNLRHTFCTRFCENETNLKVIQEIMGHSDISITMNVYAEATKEKKREAFNNLEGKIKIS